MLFIFLRQSLEVRQCAFNSLCGNAEGDANVSGAAKSVAGDEKKIIFFRALGESDGVGFK